MTAQPPAACTTPPGKPFSVIDQGSSSLSSSASGSTYFSRAISRTVFPVLKASLAIAAAAS